jgi:hypothetical protein
LLQQLVDKRRFAVIYMGDDRDIAKVLNVGHGLCSGRKWPRIIEVDTAN